MGADKTPHTVSRQNFMSESGAKKRINVRVLSNLQNITYKHKQAKEIRLGKHESKINTRWKYKLT